MDPGGAHSVIVRLRPKGQPAQSAEAARRQGPQGPRGARSYPDQVVKIADLAASPVPMPGDLERLRAGMPLLTLTLIDGASHNPGRRSTTLPWSVRAQTMVAISSKANLGLLGKSFSVSP